MMMYGKKTRSAKTAICLLLAVVTLVSLLLPWFSMKLEVMGGEYQIPEILELAYMMEGTNEEMMLADLREDLAELNTEMKALGASFNEKSAIGVVRSLLDGQLSPVELAKLCSFTGGLVKEIDRAVAAEGNKMSAGDMVLLRQLQEAGTKLTVAGILLWVLVIGFALACLYCIYEAVNNDLGTGTRAFGIWSMVMGVAAIAAVFAANQAMENAMSLLEGILDNLLWTIGAGGMKVIDLRIFHVTAVPILVILFGAVMLLADFLGMEKVPAIPAKLPSVPELPKCPACGAHLSWGAAFCSKCGAAAAGKTPVEKEMPRVVRTPSGEEPLRRGPILEEAASGGSRLVRSRMAGTAVSAAGNCGGFSAPGADDL